LLFDGAAQIGHQMKAIGDLRGLRRAAPSALGVRAVAIAADDRDTRMRGEPGRDRIGRAHREDIHDATPLQIDEDRPEVEGQLISARES
jgi:hypothetical protein